MTHYYLDTCIWRDYYENRGTNNKLGREASNMMINLISRKATIILSDLVIKELGTMYKEIASVFVILSALKVLKIVRMNKSDWKNAKTLAYRRNIPAGDAAHAYIARHHNAILVTQDRHFDKLKDITIVMKPNEV